MKRGSIMNLCRESNFCSWFIYILFNLIAYLISLLGFLLAAHTIYLLQIYKGQMINKNHNLGAPAFTVSEAIPSY